MMNNLSLATYQLSESPLDLRAPVFAKLRKGAWWMRLTMLAIVDYILLSIAWLIPEYQTVLMHSHKLVPSDFFSIFTTACIQIGALALQGNYQAGKKRFDYFNIIKTLIFADGLIIVFSFFYQPFLDVSRSELIISLLLSIYTIKYCGRVNQCYISSLSITNLTG